MVAPGSPASCGGLHQGPVDLAVRLQALVEGPRQARRLLDRNRVVIASTAGMPRSCTRR